MRPLFTPNSYDLAPDNTYQMVKREYFMGLDLGQRRDYSASSSSKPLRSHRRNAVR
jgi:hypothetical protein